MAATRSLAAIVSAAACAASGPALRAGGDDDRILMWHVTDPHVDPFYRAGTQAEPCYCRSHALCPARPESQACAPGGVAGPGISGLFGNAEADCETPENLFTSSLSHAAAVAPAALVLFTGDFCAYMLETPCNTSAAGTEPGSSRAGLLSCIVDAYGGVRSAFPEALVLPSFGNHDTVVMEYGGGGSAAVFGGTGQMAWLYSAAADLWAIPAAIGCSAAGGDVGGDDFSCAEARRTLLLGGYFATRVPQAGLNLTVLSLNTNYWSVASNYALRNASSEACLLGEGMFGWAVEHLAAAAARGDKVMVLGHIPPHSSMWSAGFYRRWITALTPHYKAGLMLPHFFGHMHTDEWMVVRECTEPAGGGDGGQWTKTTGIKWCSGSDLQLEFDPFGQGFSGAGTYCPWLPPGVVYDVEIAMCEAVCSRPNLTAMCAGFTYYPSHNGTDSQCCFRSDTSNKPVDPTSGVECYEKDRSGGGGEECAGEPLGVMVTGPSVSYAFPAANPTIRLMEFSGSNLSLLDMSTYTADLHAANAKGSVDWALEYGFATTFGLGNEGLSPKALAGLVERMVPADSPEWERYRGADNGTLFCRGWMADIGKADSHCEQPCSGDCKTMWLDVLNGTATN